MNREKSQNFDKKIMTWLKRQYRKSLHISKRPDKEDGFILGYKGLPTSKNKKKSQKKRNIMSNRIFGDYDKWKTASPYDNEPDTALVNVEVETFPGVQTITVEVPYSHDDFERQLYIDEDDVREAVAEEMDGRQYEIAGCEEI